jgi:hypothetical protein
MSARCKLIDNGAKRKISFYTFLMTWGLFVIFSHPALYGLTRSVFKSASFGLYGIVAHGFLAGLVAGLITYVAMDPGKDQESCPVASTQ